MTTESREQDPGSARASRKSRGSPAIIEAGGSGKLDTSGAVNPHPMTDTSPYWLWSDLDPFTQGYIEALFASMDRRGPPDWAICNNGKTREGYRSALVAFSDLAPETLARIIEDCTAFAAALEMDAADPVFGPENGRRFWRSRQAPAGARPEWYAALLAPFPPLTPYLGDDGRVYLREQS